MANRISVRLLVAVVALSLSSFAQMLPLGKVPDPASRELQRKYVAQLQQLSADVAGVHFAYPFYFSQTLDVDEVRQKQLPQGSIHFDTFNSQTVLAITGNYYISYSSKLMTANQRARKTYEDVVLPLLKVEVARLDRSIPIDGYAFEIAHHVRSQVLKVNTEGPENLMIMFPRAVAERLARGKDVESQQAALLDSQVYLNGEPLTLWLTGDDAPGDVKDHYLARQEKQNSQKTLAQETAGPAEPGTLVSSKLIPQSELLNKIRERESSPHEVSTVELEKLETAYQDTVRRLTNELSGQAHFVDYAPPAFIAFRNGAYLQLNMNTDLDQPAGPSQYRIAALAFDTHIAHVLRAASKYFHENPSFDGIDFSTTVHQAGQSSGTSLEFVVPFTVLRAYEKYDCTGQELINRSIVLINGERVTLDLQKAETEMVSGR